MRGAALLALAMLAPTFARAESASLAEAREAYFAVEYDRVLPLLERALTETEDAAELREIHELRATVYVMYGDNEAAQRAFVDVLRLDPDYDLPENSSPTVRAAFDAARRRVAAAVPPEPVQPVPPAPPTSPEATIPTTGGGAARRRQSVPFYSEWWFWTAVGAGLVGVGAGTWAIWSASQPDRPGSDFGPYTFGP